MWSAFRVRAPLLEATPALDWVLQRAFSEHASRITGAVDVASARALSGALDLDARIATRHALTLSDELGPAAAREMSFHRLQTVAIDRVLSALSEEIAEVARALGLPVVLLKHAALRRSGAVAEGERYARDVDVLVSPSRTGELQSALQARGFRAAERAPVMHLPPLSRGPGEVIEIHHTLWGVRVASKSDRPRDATADDLLMAGLTQPLPDGLLLPNPRLLAAHAIVHGFVQHRTSPEGYPSMRALCDLAALRVSEERGHEICSQYIQHTTSPALTAAAIGLAQFLRSGAPLSELEPSEPELELLAHLVAASVDQRYRRALRFERLAELGSLPALRSALDFGLATPTDSAAQSPNSGRDWSAPGVVHRLRRPLQLAMELAHGAASYAALQLRRGSRLARAHAQDLRNQVR